jgi:hypothetical protein
VIHFIREASTLQFALAIIAFVTFMMIVLQGAINRAVWTGYLIAFFVAIIGLAVTLR